MFSLGIILLLFGLFVSLVIVAACMLSRLDHRMHSSWYFCIGIILFGSFIVLLGLVAVVALRQPFDLIRV